MANNEGPLWQLEQNAKRYRESASAYHADSVRYLKMAETASNMADEYDAAILKFRQ